ncbi:LRR 8 domain containing protein [Asbolus verrucosus]|uniref:LRR 8 domain containing protein n=1 Tax=Asbolus verrucosus TaxID=1661398 RepID=A0A482W0G0_ASBVE|nr:LRR 8 domain containing protein [Asbolus verrucosus]
MITSNCVLLTIIVLSSPVNCEVFENVSLSLSTQWQKLFIHGQPPRETVFIESSNSLGEYVNLQPLELVTITNQEILELKEDSLANLPNIYSIHITSSGIKKIEPGTFKNVPKLDYVNLSDNRIEQIEDGVFTNLQLRALYLQNNKISKLGAAAFNNMTLLTEIVLSYNKISTWNSDWFIGTRVGSVYIAHNMIEELPADVFAYIFPFKRINAHLTVWNFIISNNGLKKVHEDAFRNVNGFGIISLANNSLEYLPSKVFRWVKGVNVLDLKNNQISNIDGLFDDISIKYLHLDDNRLSCFPTDIFYVSIINHVLINRNPLTCNCFEHWKQWQKRNNVVVFYSKQQEKCIGTV